MVGHTWHVQELVKQLMAIRSDHCFPWRIHPATRKFANTVLAILFPHFSDVPRCDEFEILAEVAKIKAQLIGLITSLGEHFQVPEREVSDAFLDALPGIYQRLMLDARAIHAGDPAAVSVDEVILTYPGFLAIAIHRIAHELARLEIPVLPRLLSEHAHERTGIDIHPKATVGSSFFIDHGTGIVIGETSVIGNGVKLYQGVTLGALSVEKRLSASKRHPTLEDHVVVYANATILGGDTVIGHDTIVGANAWITESIPAFSVVGRTAEIRPRRSETDAELEFHI